MEVVQLEGLSALETRSRLEAYQGCALTMGNFDGVHKGHQRLIDECTSRGQKRVVVTFNPHPEKVLKNKKDFFKIFTHQQNLSRFELFDIDCVVVIPFDKSLLYLSAIDFLEKYIVKSLSPQFIIVGDDFKFGKNREGTTDFLESKSSVYNYKFISVSKISVNSQLVSSSAIRECLINGNITEVNNLLGAQAFFIEGVISEGKKLGRTIGFPTINFNNVDTQLKSGVYKTRTIIKDGEYHSISNLGCRPTVSSSGDIFLETHIFDFSENIYGKKARVYFDQFLRDEAKFSDTNDLKKQIEIDVKNAKAKV